MQADYGRLYLLGVYEHRRQKPTTFCISRIREAIIFLTVKDMQFMGKKEYEEIEVANCCSYERKY